MRPVGNRPARLYGTAKRHKSEHPRNINTEKIKFLPIIDQTGTCI